MRPLLIALALGLAAAVASPQSRISGGETAAEAAAPPGPLERAAIEATLRHLASDEMGGRDTPSPQLERAADWIAKRFAAAGLEPGCGEDGWFHRYELEGAAFSAEGFALEIRVGEKALKLEPGRDARLLRCGGAFEGEDLEIDRFAGDDSEMRRLRARGGRRPLIIEVAEDSPAWKATTGRRESLGSRRRRPSPPVFLVREGLLPEGALRGRIAVVAPEPTTLALRNVVGVLPGRGRPGERLLVSAHYDHIGIGLPVGRDLVYNGADDDASGTTAVIHLAEALAASGPHERSLVFVAFSAEEKGLLGSRAFAERPPFPLKSVVANLNLEMLGRPPEKGRFSAWFTGSDLSDLESLCRPGFERAGVEITTFAMQRQLFRASDNWSLAAKGVVAQSISAGSLHGDYHKPTDEAGLIDFEHMTRVIGGLHEALLDLAKSEALPSWNEAGRKIVGAGR